MVANEIKYAKNMSKIYKTIRIENPIWATYPAWISNDIAFLKYYNCQGRLFGGNTKMFPSCDNIINTGVKHISQVKNIRKFHGNKTIKFSKTPLTVDGYIESQLLPHAWRGFKKYPYLYDFSLAGDGFSASSKFNLFSKEHFLNLELTQNDILIQYKEFTLNYPISSAAIPQSTIADVNVRRLGDSSTTWDRLAQLSDARDTFQMPYTVPKGMASLEAIAGFPIFAGTPHHFGNKVWGGREYQEILGLNPQELTQMSYIDYDPVTGRSIRSANRQQV
jgi:hypothetical protein